MGVRATAAQRWQRMHGPLHSLQYSRVSVLLPGGKIHNIPKNAAYFNLDLPAENPRRSQRETRNAFHCGFLVDSDLPRMNGYAEDFAPTEV